MALVLELENIKKIPANLVIICPDTGKRTPS